MRIIIEADNAIGILGLSEGLANILIPTLVTLSVFILGQLINWYSKRITLKKKLQITKNVIVTWVEEIKDSVTNNIEEFDNTIQALNENTDLQAIAPQLSPIIIYKLREISLQEIQAIILNMNIKGPKGKAVYEVVSNIELLSEVVDKIKEEYKNFYNYSKDLIDQYFGKFLI